MTDRSRARIVAALVCVLAVGVGVAVWTDAGPTTGDDSPGEGTSQVAAGATRVDSCTAITAPGRYVLVENLTNASADVCIEIRASGVVFDGANRTVDGQGSFGSAGVRVGGEERLSNVTVRDVTVTDWDDGVRFLGVDDGAVVGASVARTRIGLTLLDSNGNRVVDSTARENRLYGVSVVESSANNRIENTTVSDNVMFGVHLVGPGVANNTLANAVARNNEYGVVLVGARDNRLTGTVASGNRIAGIWLSAADGNRLDDNVVSNRFYGVFLSSNATGNRIERTDAADNAVGVRLRSSDRNRVAGNAVTGSSDAGILLIESDDVVVVDNRLDDNRRGVAHLRSENLTLGNNSAGTNA